MCWRLVIPIAAWVSFAGLTAGGDEPLTFESDIRPILKAHCLDCHGATDQLKGGLDLRLRRFMLRGGESGPAIAPGDPGASYLLQRVRDGEMPPGQHRVPEDEVARLQRWIAAGAPTAREEPEQLDPGIGITPEERAFWSFQPIRRPEIPDVGTDERVRTPIDAFLWQRLREQGLSFSADADRASLMIRAYFDLTGLPPNPDEAAAYLADDSPDAYERLIDHLLESPHYGERWARHWLDVAGYADSEGYTNADADRPWAYKYRDYVIKSLNDDKPFDQFLREQLAGDEMVPPPHQNLSADQIEKLVATGFLRMAADGTGSGANDDAARNQMVADTLKIVSTSLLGLSVGCAQCHDHRYDPIPQRDYYQLRAIFEPALDWKQWRTPQQRLISLYTDADRARAAEVEAEAGTIAKEKQDKQQKYISDALGKELEKHDAELREQLRVAYQTPGDKRTPQQQQLLKEFPSVNITAGNLYQYNQAAADDLKKYDQRISEVRAKKTVEEFIRVLSEVPGHTPQTHVFYRGEFRQPQEVVGPAALTITADPGQRFEIADDPSLPTSGRRLAYARRLTSGEHPLLTRVIVNRVWMHHFGRGLVNTPADFGALGERPTHPQLLDWLATQFVSEGWSLKKMHKLIMLSTAYRQSSLVDSQKHAVDSANSLYWRKPVLRMDAEVLRDRILATSGMLGDQLYGPPAVIKTDDTGQVIVDGATRRSIYVKVKRTQPVAMLKAFDAPVMEVNCQRRPSSTVATQSLMMMNSDFILQQARRFAERVRLQAVGGLFPEPAWELELPAAPDAAWQFGYGAYDESSQRTVSFTPLPHWTGDAWQGGPQLPDERLGWVLLRAGGGHPGENPQFAAVRRWIAPRDGTVAVAGDLQHPSAEGDGVRGRVVSNRTGLAGQWTAEHNSVSTTIEAIPVQRGDTLDFVVDCRDGTGFDSFGWTPTVTMTANGAAVETWNAAAGFHGPRASWPQQVNTAWQLAFCRAATDEELKTAVAFLVDQVRYLRDLGNTENKTDPELQALTNLCQVILSSNEFMYVD